MVNIRARQEGMRGEKQEAKRWESHLKCGEKTENRDQKKQKK